MNRSDLLERAGSGTNLVEAVEKGRCFGAIEQIEKHCSSTSQNHGLSLHAPSIAYMHVAYSKLQVPLILEPF